MNLPIPGRFVIPDIVSTHFHFKPGDTVADLGAGAGAFLPALSRMVGDTGRVVACEIQKGLVEKLAAEARALRLSNVSALWCDIEKGGGIPLSDESLDGAIVVNTFFQFEQKATAMAEIQRIIRTGGTLHIIDWTESYGGLGPAPDMIFTKAEAISLAEAHGFLFEREYPAGDHHYGVMFRAL